jgi:hypothetical protein
MYQHVSSAFERLTTEDVVRALAHVESEPARLMGRVKIAGQEEMFLTPLMNLYAPEACALAKRKKWRVDYGRLITLAHFTLYEYVKPPRCIKCKGVGVLRYRQFASARGKKNDPKEPPVCPRCKGSTFEPLRNADYARALRISEVSFKTNDWLAKQKEIRTILDWWLIDCISGVLDFMDPDDNA